MIADVLVDPACATLVHASGSVVATLATRDRYADRTRADSVSSDDPESDSSSAEDSDTSSDYSDGTFSSQSTSDGSEAEDSATHSNIMLKIWSVT